MLALLYASPGLPIQTYEWGGVDYAAYAPLLNSASLPPHTHSLQGLSSIQMHVRESMAGWLQGFFSFLITGHTPCP